MAALFGADDQAAKRTSKLVDWSSPLQALLWSWRTVAPDGSLRDRLVRLKGIKDEGAVTKKFMAVPVEVRGGRGDDYLEAGQNPRPLEDYEEPRSCGDAWSRARESASR